MKFFQFIKFIFIGVFITSCSDLKYVPVKTPSEVANERKEAVKQQLFVDFQSRNLTYSSITFGKSSTIKPPSYYKLDSLYDLKYQLELRNQTSSDLENKIKIQKLIIANDTSSVYFLEHHVFGVEQKIDSILKIYTVYNAEIYVNQKNKIETMNVLESVQLDKKLAEFYACYVLKESFIYPHTTISDVESEFYKLYDTQLTTLEGNERQEFLEFMLSVMKLAYKYSNLDKEFLIKEFTRTYTQGNLRNMLDEKFVKIEEFFNDKNDLLYYKVDYIFSQKNEKDEMVAQEMDIFLDPYLQLIEMRKK